MYLSILDPLCKLRICSNENNCIYQLLLTPQKCVPILALVLTSQHPFRNEEIIIISASGDSVKILLVMIKSRQEMIHSRRVHLLFWITHLTRYLGALSKRDIFFPHFPLFLPYFLFPQFFMDWARARFFLTGWQAGWVFFSVFFCCFPGRPFIFPNFC